MCHIRIQSAPYRFVLHGIAYPFHLFRILGAKSEDNKYLVQPHQNLLQNTDK